MMKSLRSIDIKDAKLAMAHMYIAFTALLVGATAGLLQTLERSGKFDLPFGIGYYQILTVHGVVLGLVLTTFFILGFMLAAQSKTAGSFNSSERKMAWFGYWMMTVGVVITTIFILLNEATVLYTFYAPLMAHPAFYIGLTLVIVGSWFEGFVIFRRHARFRRENPGETDRKSTRLNSSHVAISYAV